MGRKPKFPGSTFSYLWYSKRITAVLFAAAVSYVFVVVSGFQPSLMWDQWRRLSIPPQKESRATVMLPVPMGVVDPYPIGTDSSISNTPLKLLLAATRPGRNAHEGYALIGVSVLSPQTYTAGAILANGTRLREIYREYVVLERNGKTTRLFVAGREPAGYQPNLASIASVGGSATSNAHADSQDTLTNVIRASPTYRENVFAGLQVFANSRSDVFARLGLQDADIITMIDGERLSDQKSAIASLRPLVNGQSLTAVIRRGDQVQTIPLDGSVML